MSTLLIWECVPEETHVYLIPDAHVEGFRQYLTEAHGKYINQEENDGTAFVNMAISSGTSPEGLPFREHEGIWKDFKVNLDEPMTNVGVTSVYITGFIM